MIKLLKKTVCITVVLFLIVISSFSFAQKIDDIRENTSKKNITWTLLQLVPSPVFYQDSDDNNARIQFGFKWHITPINISFNPNKYVSPVQFFRIDPVRRFTGSAELFVQPELATADFKYSNLSIFGITTGVRAVLPISERGENLAFSLGGKYTYRKNFTEDKNAYYGVEAGLYFFGGMMGFQYTQNFNTRTNYNFNFYIKYF